MKSGSVEAIYPLAPQQQGMLFETLARDPGIYVEQVIVPIEGEVWAKGFERACQQMVDRHPILRTAFIWDSRGTPVQVVLHHVDVPVDHQDWRALSRDEQLTARRGYLIADRRRGFDPARAPLFRTALLRLGERAYEAVVSQHHLLMDGWSLAIVLEELGACYRALANGEVPQLPPQRPYRDYITWLQHRDRTSAEVFWRENLQGFKHPTALGRPAADDVATDDALRGPSFGELETQLGADLTAKLEALTRRRRLTANTLLQGVWAGLLSRYSGDDDVVFGTVVSGRPPGLPGVERMVGLFSGSVPFRVRVRPDATCSSWLSGLQRQHLELRQFEHFSPGEIQQWSEVGGSRSLYESLFVFENYPGGRSPTPSDGRAAEGPRSQFVGAWTRYALALLVVDGPSLTVRAVFDRRRLDDRGVGHMLAHVVSLTAEIVADPDQPLHALLERVDQHETPVVRADRGAAGRGGQAQGLPPRTPAEISLASIWSRLLGIEAVGLHDNFFELGGHSLLASQLLSQLRLAYQVEVPLRLLFEAPTLADQAAVIADAVLQQIEGMDDEDAARLLRTEER